VTNAGCFLAHVDLKQSADDTPATVFFCMGADALAIQNTKKLID